ncbi:ABC-F type ribosomal protection protein [Clostridium sp. 19966]|uniref:ribosomal protection-like ABC-F family protein n=1 Tax=Clostridium sp. 19966 TaxID=2768166 RepID=UPI0028DDD46E|nr:ABC-F type ribosomal protection protein [Clostridium sp. 19966]MDT8715979.1 ABC-F type ribosomal protection protein [Clostridium sp. 19966]
MLLMECKNIKKYFGNRKILEIESLKIYSEDRIGIVGVNGAGKTTLTNIINQRNQADEGIVKLYGKASYVSQLEEPENKSINSRMSSKFGAPSLWKENMSGGEKTRFKLAEAFSDNTDLLFADEPTSNLDIEGIELIEKIFAEYKGALVIISHDRDFLDKVCNKIWELEDGKVKIYNGNFSEYYSQKAEELKRNEFEYEEYIKEKKRLEDVILESKQKVKSIRKTPKRMGNSEARLHKMGGQKAKATIERAVKNVEKRIENLEIKEKPKVKENINVDISEESKLYSRIILEGYNIRKKFNNKIIFDNAEFKIYNGSKVALIGSNGCGKSTLIKMIMNNDFAIKITQKAKIGYFSQDMSILDEELSIIENVMKDSIYDETFSRILLSRLLFKREDIYKNVSVLSGGEKVKVSLAKILLSDINMLILDEPTNYMDIASLQAVESALKEYGGTLLFVSHDRRFIESIADEIMVIENNKIINFKGRYDEYLARKDKSSHEDNKHIKNEILILQNRMSEIIGRLSAPSKKDDIKALDKEYNILVEKIKALKEALK